MSDGHDYEQDAEAIPTPTRRGGSARCMEARHDQLKELVKSGKVDATK